MTEPIPSLAQLLEKFRVPLQHWVEVRGHGLLRFEDADDLVQEIHMRALAAEAGFQYRGEASFWAWLRLLGERYVADRNRYWSSQKRQAGRLLRIASGGGSTFSSRIGVEPEALQPGASTFAMRRERLVQAAKVLSALLPRDQLLIDRIAQERSIRDTAEELGISYDAAERARNRALGRFRQLFQALTQTPTRSWPY